MPFVIPVLQPTILFKLGGFSILPRFGVCREYLLMLDSLHVASRSELPQFCPTPRGSVELMQEDRPIYLAAGPLRRGCSRQFSPQGADIKAGRQGPTWLPGGVASRLISPSHRLPPFSTYIEYVGQEKG